MLSACATTGQREPSCYAKEGRDLGSPRDETLEVGVASTAGSQELTVIIITGVSRSPDSKPSGDYHSDSPYE